MKNPICLSIMIALLAQSKASAVVSNLDSLGVKGLYEMTLAAPWESEGDCQYMSRYMGGPSAYAYQVSPASEAEDEMLQRGLSSDNYPMIIKSFYQPLESCATMRPIPGRRNIHTYFIAEKTEVYSERFDEVTLRFSLPCDKSATRFDEDQMRLPCGDNPRRMNWLIQFPKNRSTGILEFFGFNLLAFRFQNHHQTVWVSDEDMGSVNTYIGGVGKNLIPVSNLEEWHEHLKDRLTACKSLQSDADKTKAEATAKYEDLYSKALKGGEALRGPDGRGLRGISDGFKARVAKHVHDMAYEKTCDAGDIKKYQDSMEVLIEEIRKIEIMSQGLWG